MIAAHSAVTRAWIGLVLASVFWAGNALVARAVRDSVPPFSLSFWRWTLALVILLPFVAPGLWRERERIRRGGWRLLLLSAMGIGFYNMLLYKAAHTTEAINLTLVTTCLPLVTFIAAGLLMRDWPPRRAWYGLVVAAAGLIWLISRGELGRLLALRFNTGDLLMLVAVADWALYSVLLRRWAAWVELPSLSLLGLMILLCVPMLLPFYLYELFTIGSFAASPANLGAIAYTAVCSSLVAYFAWTYGVRVVGAAKAALTSYLMPVFTALLGWLLLGEHLQSFHWIGAALIFSGLLLATRTSAR